MSTATPRTITVGELRTWAEKVNELSELEFHFLLKRAANTIEKLERKIMDMGWELSPDRMGS